MIPKRIGDLRQRPTTQINPAPGSGGPESENSQIMVWGGPFFGPQLDLQRDLVPGSSSFADSQNVDIRFGALETRPGYTRILDFDESYGTTQALMSAANPQVTGCRSLEFVEVLHETEGANIVAVGKWMQRDRVGASAQSTPPSTLWSQSRQRYLEEALYSENSGGGGYGQRVATVTAPGVVQVTTGVAPYGPFDKNRIIGGQFRSAGDAEWRAITSVTDGDTMNVAAGAAVVGAVGFEIVTPMWVGDDHMGTGFTDFRCDYASVPLSASGYTYTTGTASSSAGVAEQCGTVVTGVLTNWYAGGITAGMSFKYDADDASKWHGIVAVDPSGTVIMVAPQITTARAGVAYTIRDRKKLFVTGYPGGTIVSPGANPRPAQAGTDLPLYLGNCCAWYDGRMFQCSDMSYATVNGTTPLVHPGRLAWSRVNVHTQWNNHATAGFADMDLGVGLWMFVLRNTLYVVHEKGITAVQATGRLDAPYQLGAVVTEKEYVDWAKPIVVDGGTAILWGKDDIYAFDGGSPNRVGGGLREYYRYLIHSYSLARGSRRGFYDQTRNRIFLARGEALDGSNCSEIFVGHHTEQRWATWNTATTDPLDDVAPEKIGGFFPWVTASSSRAAVGNNQFGTGVENGFYSTNDASGTTKDAIYYWSAGAGVDTDATTYRVINWSVDSPTIDMGDPRRLKTIRRIALVHEAMDDNNPTTNTCLVTVTVRSDREQELAEDVAEGSVRKLVSTDVELVPTASNAVGYTLTEWLTPGLLTGKRFWVRLEDGAMDPNTQTIIRPRIIQVWIEYTLGGEERQL